MLRRELLKYLVSIPISFSVLLKPITTLAKWNQEAFDATDYKHALNSYFSNQQIEETDQIKIGVHSNIENGAVVPIKVNTDLPSLKSITIFVDNNPTPLIANFDMTPACLGFVSTRIKMEQPSNIIVVVKSGEKLFSTKTFVEVHEGGCG